MSLKIIKLKYKPNHRLVLTLKSKWFYMWSSGFKKEDYRELTPKWLSMLFGVKLVHPNGDSASIEDVYNWMAANGKQFLAENPVKQFEYIELNHAFKSDRPQCKSKFIGVQIRTGVKKWGAKNKRIYFCIMGEGIYARRNVSDEIEVEFNIRNLNQLKKEYMNLPIGSEEYLKYRSLLCELAKKVQDQKKSIIVSKMLSK